MDISADQRSFTIFFFGGGGGRRKNPPKPKGTNQTVMRSKMADAIYILFFIFAIAVFRYPYWWYLPWHLTKAIWNYFINWKGVSYWRKKKKQTQKKRKTERVIIRGNCSQIPLLAAAYDQRLISGDKHWLMFSEMHILQCSLSWV